MPYKKGSCLNEEYTEEVTKIYELMKEAEEKYNALPVCIKDVSTRFKGESLGYFLINGVSSARCFVEEFGISLED